MTAWLGLYFGVDTMCIWDLVCRRGPELFAQGCGNGGEPHIVISSGSGSIYLQDNETG